MFLKVANMKTTTKKTESITIRLTPDQAHQLELLAEYLDRTLSDTARRLLTAAMVDLWAKIEAEKHESQPMEKAIFKG